MATKIVFWYFFFYSSLWRRAYLFKIITHIVIYLFFTVNLPRLLIASNSIVLDSSILESVPLGLSAANDVVFGSSCRVLITNIGSTRVGYTSIDDLIRERAVAGYCADAAKNIQLLTEELIHLQETIDQKHNESYRHHFFSVTSLCRVWNWVARIESLEVSSVTEELISFASSGILTLVAGKDAEGITISSYPSSIKSLGISHYYSPERLTL